MVIANDNDFCCSQLAFIHDELQYECHPEHANDLKFRLELSAVRKLESITTSESPLQLRERSEKTGLTCTRCGETKPIDEFRNYTMADTKRQGKFYHCKDCEKKQRDGVGSQKERTTQTTAVPML